MIRVENVKLNCVKKTLSLVLPGFAWEFSKGFSAVENVDFSLKRGENAEFWNKNG